MIAYLSQHTDKTSISRETFLLMLYAALDRGSYRFARQAALEWLSDYPGDLVVNLLLARAWLGEGNLNDASEILSRLIIADPEFSEAYYYYVLATKKQNPGQWLPQLACLYALEGEALFDVSLPDWADMLREAHMAFLNGEYDKTEEQLYRVLGLNLNLSLPAVMHLQLSARRQDETSVANLALIYHTRWQECLHFALYRADTLIRQANEAQGLALLRQCVINDPAAQVASRLWGRNFTYRPLWPETLEIEFLMPVPAEVAKCLGWNQLSAGHVTSAKGDSPDRAQVVSSAEEAALPIETLQSEEQPQVDIEPPTMSDHPVEQNNRDVNPLPEQPEMKSVVSDQITVEPSTDSASDSGCTEDVPPMKFANSVNESLKPISDAIQHLAKKINHPVIAKADGRFPVYVIFSSRLGLISQYGQQTMEILESEMKRLVAAIRKRPGWGAMIYFPDDIKINKAFNLKGVQGNDPWRLKLALVDLDQALAKKGARIGALLIVGGPEVVPFHRLPNPTEDADDYVLSDSPYSTLDSNYFVSEWPTGRLPGGNDSDAGLLLEQLRNLVNYHQQFKQHLSWWQALFARLQNFRIVPKGIKRKKTPHYFGYSAAVWKASSQVVFRPLAEKQALFISPPETSGSIEPELITDAMMGYYNLHGLSDSAEWYGQRDMSDPVGGEDYPVALSVKDLIKNGRAPRIIFAEACYGAYINNKAENESVALRFLGIGVPAFIGSTGISYGSITAPLIGADLLGYLFWKNIQEGYSVGDAFNLAKINLVREMNRRQGFLDGEDQKTLVSFVLYGDPLMKGNTGGSQTKSLPRLREQPAIKTICDRRENDNSPRPIPQELLIEVKKAVHKYLPGFDAAEIFCTEEHVSHQESEHRCPMYELGGKAVSPELAGRKVITMSKQIRAGHVHTHYVKATVDKSGKLVKLAVSH